MAKLTETEIKYAAQDSIIAAIIATALAADEAGNQPLAAAIRREGAKIAHRYGITDIPGLPATAVAFLK